VGHTRTAKCVRLDVHNGRLMCVYVPVSIVGASEYQNVKAIPYRAPRRMASHFSFVALDEFRSKRVTTLRWTHLSLVDDVHLVFVAYSERELDLLTRLSRGEYTQKHLRIIS
jgi:hypothetical protein